MVVDRPPALIHPVGLCVDTDRRRLYWFDAEYHAVATSDYDGTDVVIFRFYVGVVNMHVYKVTFGFSQCRYLGFSVPLRGRA